MLDSHLPCDVHPVSKKLMVFQRSIDIEARLEAVFGLCASRRGFERHFPHKVRNYVGPEVWELASAFSFEYRYLGVWMPWAGEIVAMEANKYFIDVMHKGIFASFVHRHDFEVLDKKTRYTDTIHYSLGFAGALDASVGRALLARTFAKRQALLKSVLENVAPHAALDNS